MSSRNGAWHALLCGLLLSACDAPRVAPETRGVSVDAGPCGRGLLVIESDYQSSNVSALGWQGEVLSASLASSNTEAAGFGVALSGDVTSSSSPQTGPNIVLIDRYPAGVLRFIELKSARLVSELAVGTGFRANPQDYLELTPHRAYVARYEANPNPGREAFDGGGDILIVDPSVPSVAGRIDLAPALDGVPAPFTPHPARLVRVGERVFALLAAYADDYSRAVDSRLVELDPTTDTLQSTLVLEGLRGCDALAVSPDGSELAVACTGDDLRSMPAKLDNSGLALVDISAEPRVSKQFTAAELGRDPIGFGLAYAARRHFEATGAVGALDSIVRLDTHSGGLTTVLRSDAEPFTLGAVHCALNCGACYAADAKRGGGSVLRFAVDASGLLSLPNAFRAETQIGLPPRYLGVF